MLLMQDAQSAAAAEAEAPLSHLLLAFADNCARAGSSVSGHIVVLARQPLQVDDISVKFTGTEEVLLHQTPNSKPQTPNRHRYHF